jgi:hypothetical protein
MTKLKQFGLSLKRCDVGLAGDGGWRAALSSWGKWLCRDPLRRVGGALRRPLVSAARREGRRAAARPACITAEASGRPSSAQEGRRPLAVADEPRYCHFGW